MKSTARAGVPEWSATLLMRGTLLILALPLVIGFALGGAIAGIQVAVGSLLDEWRTAWRAS